VVLNHLYKYTQLQTSFSVNNIALVDGRPMMLDLKSLIHYFVEHRHDVVIRRTKYELRKAEERLHIIEGLIIALDNLDAIIKMIRESKSPDEAREGLMTGYSLSELQARAILDMRLQRLTGLERDKIREEYNELLKLAEYLRSILADEALRMKIIKDELVEVRDKYGDERKTEIIFAADEMSIEDLIADDEVVVTVSHAGYIKRTNLSEYKVQNRGGVGSKGSKTRDNDFLEHLFVATNHNFLLIFTEKGKCFWMRVFEVPEGNKVSKGRAIQNLINIEPDDKVLAIINVKDLRDDEYINNNFIVLCTKGGIIKKTSLEAYSRPRQNGIIAINVREGDTLLDAKLTSGSMEIMMALKSGKSIRFNESKVRPMGRNASGVKGVTLADDTDEVVGMIAVDSEEDNVLVVSEKGYGKRSPVADYRVTNRGGKGVKTISVTEKTGNLISIKNVTDADDLMIINKSGLVIRLRVADLRVMGRATQGVRLINLKGNDGIAAVAKVEGGANDDEALEGVETVVPISDGEVLEAETDDLIEDIDDVEADDEPTDE